MARRDLKSAHAYFARIRRLNPISAAAYNDLGVVCLEENRPARALVMFRKALRFDPNFRSARNSAMELCLQNGWSAAARRILDQTFSEKMTTVSAAEVHRWRELLSDHALASLATASPHTVTGKKIAIFASHDVFIKDIAAGLSVDNQVRKFEGDTLERMQELLRWADIAWFEWCDQLLVAATTLPKSCKIICRLHSYEAFTDMPSQVDWSKVDHVVFVNQSVRNIVGKRIPDGIPTTITYNGVNLERFTLPAGKPVTKKIASVGYINYKKNPALLLYAFKKIHEYDPQYTLHIAGQHQDPRLELYMSNFLNRHPLPVYFEGWVDDMPAWYADKQFVISTSLFESFHYSIAEGMASGCLPLIHDWYGADTLYPQEYLFGDPDRCLEIVKRLERADLNTTRRRNREYIADRYDEKGRTPEIHDLIARVLESPNRDGKN
jgi:tetratricopeptide (TPR) repeat protein